MQIEPKAIYANLKNWDFDVLGPYRIKEEEAKAVMEICDQGRKSNKKGIWIQIDETKCKCSVCETITLIAQYPRGDKNFCPNCGADMRG